MKHVWRAACLVITVVLAACGAPDSDGAAGDGGTVIAAAPGNSVTSTSSDTPTVESPPAPDLGSEEEAAPYPDPTGPVESGSLTQSREEGYPNRWPEYDPAEEFWPTLGGANMYELPQYTWEPHSLGEAAIGSDLAVLARVSGIEPAAGFHGVLLTFEVLDSTPEQGPAELQINFEIPTHWTVDQIATLDHSADVLLMLARADRYRSSMRVVDDYVCSPRCVFGETTNGVAELQFRGEGIAPHRATTVREAFTLITDSVGSNPGLGFWDQDQP